MFFTTCNKVFHIFPNCAVGVFFPQRIWKDMKNCLLLLLVLLLFMPTIPTFAVDSRAAKPVPPDGYEERELTFTIENVESNILTFVTTGNQTATYTYSFNLGFPTVPSLSLDSIWNKTLYLDYVSTPNQFEGRWTNSDGSWSDWITFQPVLGGHFSIEQLYGDTVTGNVNTPYLYLPMVWNNRGLINTNTLTFNVHISFNGQKAQRRNDFTLHFIYFEWVGTDTDKTIAAIGDAAQQITNAVTNNTNVVRNGFTQVQTGISTINGNLNNINTSIVNGFQGTIDNLQSLESSVNAGFVDVENGIKQQTTQIQNSISNQTTQITQNDNQNTQKILDQNSQFRQEDIDGANGIGKVATDFVNNTQTTIKSKWEILWYPIEFTNSVLTVFTGGSSSRSYADKYNGVVGYQYNDDSGELEPIIDLQQARYGPMQASATITFPAYTLPVLNVQIWDSYEFDLGQVKEQFPVLFNALYVVIGVLELYWFVGFLHSKYMDIFGG